MKKFLILFDLDDTLLSNQMSTFLLAYLKSLSHTLRDYIPPNKLVQTLLEATQKMIEKNTFLGTLEETFDQHFYPRVGIPKAEIQPIIDQFYKDEFPKLRGLTQPRPEALKIVQEILQMECDIAIATNPLFPRTATHQRLSWANLDHDEYPFTLVSTYESFHFCKPHPAYYAEILAQLGWQHPYVLMVGNEWDDDIFPAETMGIPTYWITGKDHAYAGKRHHASSQGAISDVLSWLRTFITAPGNPPLYQTPSALTAILKSTPAAIETLTQCLGTQSSANITAYRLDDAIHFLTQIDEEMIRIFNEILIEKRKPNIPSSTNYFTKANSDTLRKEDYILFPFFESRIEILDRLDMLSPDQWQIAVRHSTFGRGTIQKIVESIAANDRKVLQDIYQSVKAA